MKIDIDSDSSETTSRSTHRRGDRGAYQRYLDGMDSSMRQKVALVAAHLRSSGKVADMGMGSGTGSQTLAALYPSLDVVGVDLDPMMVELAAKRYDLENLEFVVGDIAKQVFADASLDAIINSSVLHHVTSFTGYRADEAGKALRVQANALKEHGVLLVRDFLAPKEQEVYLDLPDDDGDRGNDPQTCSTSRLFEKFSSDFRSLSGSPGFGYHECEGTEAQPALAKGRRRFRLSLGLATEFILRKDYRRDYQKEAKEEYCYFTQKEFEREFGAIGLRVLVSIPIRNPWILNNRYKGKLSIWSLLGSALEFPATNYIVAGEKVAAGQGVRLREGDKYASLGFLHLEHYRHKSTNHVMDLVRRPHRTIDILPWFESDGDLFVLARSSYPRPILRAHCRVNGDNASLDGATSAGYITEPLLAMQSDKPIGTTVCETLEQAGVPGRVIESFEHGTNYYPSPGGLEEIVSSTLVRISSPQADAAVFNHTGFESAGQVVAMEAQQLLRSAQVGGLLDARLEQNAYELLLQQERSVGPWIGESLSLETRSIPITKVDMEMLGKRPHRRYFEKVTAKDSAGFLDLHCAEFEEIDANEKVLHRVALEYVVPKTLSHNTIALALLCRDEDGVWIALDDTDLPAAQSFTGNSELLVAPAWRIPHEHCTMTPALGWVEECIARDYGVTIRAMRSLGGRYHPSLGTTPEVVYPAVAEVTSIGKAPRELLWIRLEEFVESRQSFQDGHLRVVAMRAAHALGIL